jgi:D-alanyl-D-alanine carboxypeptidase
VTSESRNLHDVVPGVLDKRDGLGLAGESMRDGRFVYNLQAEYAGGGIISTSRDLARWAKLLWEGGAFSAARLSEMLDGKPSEKDAKYGFATEILQTGAGAVYTHDGTIFGYLTQVIYVPKYKLAAALQINSDPVKFPISPGQCLSRIVTTATHETGAAR